MIVIAGPTAAGKSALAVEAAKHIGGEVISADSMQIYRKMDIGTAKPTLAERGGIPHHLIDVVWPYENFSAARYQRLALAAMADINARGNVPVLSGGTGFYINAVIFGNAFVPDTERFAEMPPETGRRAALLNMALAKGPTYLHKLLRENDPASAEAIHPNNVRRVARALSFFYTTGQPLSLHNQQQRSNPPAFPLIYVVLRMDRNTLYSRINARTEAMFKAGLAAEVQSLLDMGCNESMISMQGLGYKQTLPYLRGEYSLARAIELTQTETRHYAKRQITWFTHRSPGAYILSADTFTLKQQTEQIMRLYDKVNLRREEKQ